MRFAVVMSSNFEKIIREMPRNARITLKHLVDDIAISGPVQPGYKNYSKLSSKTYHCHLAYHWVACWRHEEGRYLVEVYYVGSREKAPY